MIHSHRDAEGGGLEIISSLRPLRLCASIQSGMNPNAITQQIVDAAYHLHTSLGPGLLESVYEVALAHELQKRGLRVRRQVPIPIEYDGLKFDEGFRADLLVEESVIVELKSVEKNHPVHPKQLRTHLVLAKLQLGLVLNFGLERMKDGITRIVNGLPEETSDKRSAL
jgi:GxxExxY protein